MTPMLEDMRTIRNALVGNDLRGGLVKDVADMKSSLKSDRATDVAEKKEEKRKAMLSQRQRTTLISTLIGLAGVFAGYILDKFV